MKYQGKEIEVRLRSKFDFSGFENEMIIEYYKLNHLGRKLDEKAANYLKMAKGWSFHASFAGHDGIQLALGKIFRPKKDFLFTYYRDLLTNLAAGISPEEIILNGLSKDIDPSSGGRHMSNHFSKPEIGIQNVSSAVSNHTLHAAGLARAIKKFKDKSIAFASIGESSTSEGYFYEAINTITLEKLPVIIVIQNNNYGISVPVSEQSAHTRVSDNLKGFKNLEIVNCDGRDPFDSLRALQKARNYVLSGAGPSVVHAECDRIGSHSNSDRQETYRSKDELAEVQRCDPLMQFRYHIINKGILNEEEVLKIEEANKKRVFEAADWAEAQADADGSKWNMFIVPDPAYRGENFIENNSNGEGERVSMLKAINETLKDEFRRNPNTYMWGQDIKKGGVFNVVKGIPEEFGPDRVWNSPIAEDSIVGTANGFTRYRDDIRVVIEGAEFADYFWPAMEQLVDSSHDYWRSNGKFHPNFVVRLASGGYIQGGLYHSQNLEATLTTLPGLRIVEPAFADDAVGLLRNAIRSAGITLFLEPKYLYNNHDAYTTMPNNEYMIPFGKSRIRRAGKDITVVTYGTAVHLSLKAASELANEGIEVEVIDLRSLAPWDKETVMNSIKKTNRVIVAHEDKIVSGFGAEIVAEIAKEAFNYLDAPVNRVGAKFSPVGFSKNYENIILPSVNDIKTAILEVYNF
ncbi:MAG: 2-oxoisovalerate dehydrogenase [Candidatus Kapabacteria bacterium]|nr:2-oxoisovalerate dehydrogenase [Candidatus Kapabacteria bacterium]